MHTLHHIHIFIFITLHSLLCIYYIAFLLIKYYITFIKSYCIVSHITKLNFVALCCLHCIYYITYINLHSIHCIYYTAFITLHSLHCIYYIACITLQYCIHYIYTFETRCRPTDRQTNRPTDIVTYRAAIAAKKIIFADTAFLMSAKWTDFLIKFRRVSLRRKMKIQNVI